MSCFSLFHFSLISDLLCFGERLRTLPLLIARDIKWLQTQKYHLLQTAVVSLNTLGGLTFSVFWRADFWD